MQLGLGTWGGGDPGVLDYGGASLIITGLEGYTNAEGPAYNEFELISYGNPPTSDQPDNLFGNVTVNGTDCATPRLLYNDSGVYLNIIWTCFTSGDHVISGSVSAPLLQLASATLTIEGNSSIQVGVLDISSDSTIQVDLGSLDNTTAPIQVQQTVNFGNGNLQFLGDPSDLVGKPAVLVVSYSASSTLSNKLSSLTLANSTTVCAIPDYRPSGLYVAFSFYDELGTCGGKITKFWVIVIGCSVGFALILVAVVATVVVVHSKRKSKHFEKSLSRLTGSGTPSVS